MKRRTGLVSNSSSSSFLCTFGKIIDSQKFDAWCKENSLEYTAILGEELISESKYEQHRAKVRKFFEEGTNGDFYDYMPNKEELQEMIKKDPKALYILSGDCGWGEDDFYWDGDEYDYSKVDVDEFPKEVEYLSSAGDKEGFKQLEGCMYAGRNG
jgi:hypothetical protein